MFLYLIAALNIVVLMGILKVFRDLRRGRFDEKTLESHLNERGFLNRLFGKLMRSIRRPGQMYGVGLLWRRGRSRCSYGRRSASGAGSARGPRELPEATD